MDSSIPIVRKGLAAIAAVALPFSLLAGAPAFATEAPDTPTDTEITNAPTPTNGVTAALEELEQTPPKEESVVEEMPEDLVQPAPEGEIDERSTNQPTPASMGITPAALYGDDYPAKYRNVAGNPADEWNFIARQCTSFVAWRLNSRNGVHFTNQYGGQRAWGNAKEWGAAADRAGIRRDSNPAVGAIAWSTAGDYGHVAWVAEVHGNGNIVVEEYNFNVKRGYGKRTVHQSAFTGYIHVKDIDQGSAEPFGYVDSVDSVHGGVIVRGWVIDPDTNDPIHVHIYSGGVGRGAAFANEDRPDVGAAHGRGANHGFSFFLGTEYATTPITVYGINNAAGNNPALGTRNAPASTNPIGYIDVVAGQDGKDRLKGWALDPDTREPVAVHIYRDGVGVANIQADKDRPDVDAAYGKGPNHGFDVTIDGGRSGATYEIYAINFGAGGNPRIGSVAGPVKMLTLPTVAGKATVGATLTATLGTWEQPELGHTYQWMRNGAGISGATTATYKLTNSDVGKKISVKVTTSKPGYAPAEATSLPTAKVTAGASLVSATPTVSGTMKVGQTLTAKTGSWTSGTTLKYQWLRNGKNISGATKATYTLVAADAGTLVTVKVTGTKTGYASVAKTSTNTTKVPQGVLTTATPTVSGTTKVDSKLTAKAGTWGPTPVTLTYQWLRDGKNISGATNSTYTLVAADAGKKVSVKITGTKSGYTTASKTSSTTSAIANGTLTSATPTVSGTTKVGSILTAKPGSWTSGTAFTYQWLRDGKNISGATAPTYAVIAADAGKKISVKITGKKTGYGTASKTSTTTAAVAKGSLTSVVPAVSGTAKVGSTLTAKPGSWTSGTTFAYQWLRNGKAISGATASTYTLVAADAGKKISVKITGTKSGYTTISKTSATTAAVTTGILTSAIPTISGAMKAGSTITAKTGSWTSGTTFAYQWLRNGKAISGATGLTYTLGAADAGTLVTVKITGTQTGYTTISKTSTNTAKVK